jgi:hypothetical protein
MAEVKTLPPPPPVRRFDELGRPTKAQVEYDLRLNEFIKQSAGVDPNLIAKVSQIEVTANDALARIRTEETVRAADDLAISSQVTTVQADVGKNTALINSETTARTTGDAALATRIDNLVVTSGNNAAVIIDSEAQARIAADVALGVRIDDIKADAFQNSADIKIETTARVTSDSALAQQITTLEATVNNDINAKITAETTARTTADTALANQITALQVSVGTDISARLAAEATTRAQADQALSQQITTVEANVTNNLSAKLTQTTQAVADINGNLATKWAIEGTINGTTGKLEFSGVKKADGTGAQFGLFIGANTTINGSLLVQGSITADKLSANTLSAINADMGTITAGVMRSIDGKFIIDLTNKSITISD